MRHKVNVKGVIVANDDKWIYDIFDVEATCPKDVSKAIEEANGSDLEVVINSGGGSVFDGSEIYTDLKDYQGDVEVKIVGLAASAASFIAMAGNKVRISPTAQIMIHNASMLAIGDYNDMDKASTMLRNTNKTIANAYRLKSGLEEKELLELMNEETWLNPQAAKEKGLVDEVMFEDPSIKLAANAGSNNLIPQKVIDGVRNGVMKNQDSPQGITEERIKEMFNEFRDELRNELQQNTKPTNEPSDPAPTQKTRKGFIF